MWKTTVLSLLCLCFALSGSQSTVTTTPTRPSAATTTTVSSSASPTGTVTNSSGGSSGTHTSSSGSHVAAATAQKINCKVFTCDGENCFTNGSIGASDCATATKCALIKTTNGTDVHYEGKCDSACAAGTQGDTQTFCCTTKDCNIKDSTINNNPQQGNDGTRSWARSSLILGSLLTTAFVLLV